jgi:DNA repair protein RadA/Sms
MISVDDSGVARVVGVVQSFVCTKCKKEVPRRAPRCPGCRSWGTLIRGKASVRIDNGLVPDELNELKPLGEFDTSKVQRIPTGIHGFDRVTGGGLARGRVFLVWGRPGIGKTTLVLQILSALVDKYRTAVATSEEGGDALAITARRILASLLILAYHEDDLIKALREAEEKEIDILVLDSAQMFFDPAVSGAPGGALQIENLAKKVCAFAQRTGKAVVILCQVNKKGQMKGVNALLHIVDAGFNLFKVKKQKRVFWCPGKNRVGPSGMRWKCEMDEIGRIVDRLPEIVSDEPAVELRRIGKKLVRLEEPVEDVMPEVDERGSKKARKYLRGKGR